MPRSLKPSAQDIFLAVMLGVLVYLAHDFWEKLFISGVTILQLAEGRVRFLSSNRGRAISVILQLGIIWVLIGYTYGWTSHYYLMLFLPLVSAASFSGSP